MSPGLHAYLVLSGILFTLGLTGVITRRNILLVLLSVELMLNAANLAFVAFSRHLGDLGGQVFVFFTMTVAACEVTVGLAIAVLFFRLKGTLNTDEADALRL